MTDAAQAALAAVFETLSAHAKRPPTNADVFEIVRKLGHRFTDTEAKQVLKASRVRAPGSPLDLRTDAPGSPAVAPATRERASRAARDNTLSSLSLGNVSPKEISGTNVPSPKKGSSDPLAIDFGADETLVGELIDTERELNPSGKITAPRIARLRSTLSQVRERFGDEVFRVGCEVAANKSLGVQYAIGVMRGEAARRANSTIALPLARSPTARNTGKFVHYDGERSESEVLAFLEQYDK